MTPADIRAFLEERDDSEITRVHYCYQLGSTFVNLALLEDTIIDAMAMCSRIKVTGFLATTRQPGSDYRRRQAYSEAPHSEV